MLARRDSRGDRRARSRDQEQEEREQHLCEYLRLMAKAHTGLPVAYDDVLAARETIGDRLHRTPTFSSATLSGRIGGPAALKGELFQRTGSFKPRGKLNVLAHLSAEEKARGVITISAGNAAQALAYCAALEDIDCLVVMWQGSSAAKQAATRGYGAEIDLEATTPGEAFER